MHRDVRHDRAGDLGPGGRAQLYDLPSIEIDAAALALPIKARSPVLYHIGDLRDSRFQVTARLEGQVAAVEVEAVCDTTILVDSAPEADLGPAFVEIAAEDDVRIWQTTKPVRFTALLGQPHPRRRRDMADGVDPRRGDVVRPIS
jgi:hypothetical protein